MKRLHKKMNKHLEKLEHHQREAHNLLKELERHESKEDKEYKKMRGRPRKK